MAPIYCPMPPIIICPHFDNAPPSYSPGPYRAPEPPKPKSLVIAPGDGGRIVNNQTFYAPSYNAPDYETELVRMIRARQIRINELQTKVAKYSAALSAISMRDSGWTARLEDLARDSDRQANAAAWDCMDLLMSSSGPLGALIDKLKAYGPRKTLKGVLNEEGYRKLEKALRNLKGLSPRLQGAVKDIVDSINEVLRSIEANDAGRWLNNTRRLYNALSYAEKIKDEIADGKDKSELNVALLATRDVAAKAVVELSGDILKEAGMKELARAMTFANFTADYFYHAGSFVIDWRESNRLRNCVESDSRAADTIRWLNSTATDELNWQKGELNKLQTFKLNPATSG